MTKGTRCEDRDCWDENEKGSENEMVIVFEDTRLSGARIWRSTKRRKNGWVMVNESVSGEEQEQDAIEANSANERAAASTTDAAFRLSC